jgi:hypothetical protein
LIDTIDHSRSRRGVCECVFIEERVISEKVVNVNCNTWGSQVDNGLQVEERDDAQHGEKLHSLSSQLTVNEYFHVHSSVLTQTGIPVMIGLIAVKYRLLATYIYPRLFPVPHWHFPPASIWAST